MLDTLETVRNLNAQDRCDRCGAQAYYVAERGAQDIFFCAHHAKKHGPALIAQGFSIVRDELADQLTTKPGASA